jgi:hypothetical protein
MEDRIYSFLGGIDEEETVTSEPLPNRMASGLYLDINGLCILSSTHSLGICLGLILFPSPCNRVDEHSFR